MDRLIGYTDADLVTLKNCREVKSYTNTEEGVADGWFVKIGRRRLFWEANTANQIVFNPNCFCFFFAKTRKPNSSQLCDEEHLKFSVKFASFFCCCGLKKKKLLTVLKLASKLFLHFIHLKKKKNRLTVLKSAPNSFLHFILFFLLFLNNSTLCAHVRFLTKQQLPPIAQTKVRSATSAAPPPLPSLTPPSVLFDPYWRPDWTQTVVVPSHSSPDSHPRRVPISPGQWKAIL